MQNQTIMPQQMMIEEQMIQPNFIQQQMMIHEKYKNVIFYNTRGNFKK